jgi:cold shock CspA family protein
MSRGENMSISDRLLGKTPPEETKRAQPSDKSKHSGTVKWWNDQKGFGFLTTEDDQDVFVHHSYIQCEGHKTLENGEAVEFVFIEDEKGPHAEGVVRARDLEEIPKKEEQTDTEDTFVALALFGDKIKAVELHPDGSYQFIDDKQNSHDVIYVLSRELLSLGEAVDELEELVNNPDSKESDFQRFFVQHPEFILNEDYKKAHAHIVLEHNEGGSLIPDFVLEPINGTLSDLLELKLPGAKVFRMKKNRCRFSAMVFEACAQLREYSRYFDEAQHRKVIQDKFGLLLYRPRMFVILGRRGDVDPLHLRAIQSDIPQLDVKTYDDIIERMKLKMNSNLKR